MSFSSNPNDLYDGYEGKNIKTELSNSSSSRYSPSAGGSNENITNSSNMRKSPQKINIHENYFNSTDEESTVSSNKSVKKEIAENALKLDNNEDIKSEFSYTKTIPDSRSKSNTPPNIDSNSRRKIKKEIIVKQESQNPVEILHKSTQKLTLNESSSRSSEFENISQPNKVGRNSRESYMSSISNYSGSVVDAAPQSVPIAYVNDSKDQIEADNESTLNDESTDVKRSLSKKFLKRNSTTESKQSSSSVSVAPSNSNSVKTPTRSMPSENSNRGSAAASTPTPSQSLRSSITKRFSHSKNNSITSSIPEENDTNSVVFGKLVTASPNTQMSSNKLTPAREETINVGPTLPSRSSRRPKSTIIYPNEEAMLQSPSSRKKQLNRLSDYSGMTSTNYEKTHSPKKESISTQVLKDLRNSVQNSRSPNNPMIDFSKPLPKISTTSSEGFKSGTSINSNDSYHTATRSGNNSNSSVNVIPASSSVLPPRPSKDKLERAREASIQLSIDLDKQGTETFKESPETKYDENDNDYIDIESPEKPDVKRNKSGKKHKKKSSSSSSKLKPFTYSTLVKLLESTNGTIIGEEFDHLKLPMKEKQLIEKIVDALSRLSADMVLDDNRYEIGLVRLEKALRVLEGFL